MPEHRIEIARAKVDSYVASYNGERMGEYREPLCAGARWLLSHGHAAPDDTIVMCRNGKPAMSGNVGKLAKLTVSTAAYFIKWDGGPDDLTPRPLSEQTLAAFAKGRAALEARRQAAREARADATPDEHSTAKSVPAGTQVAKRARGENSLEAA